LKFHQDCYSRPEKSCLKKEWVLPFLAMRCNLFETIYFNPSFLEGEAEVKRKGGHMNKAELINKVSEKANVTQKVAKVIVDTLFDGMIESLEKGERIEIRGFGSFVVRNYGGYKGRNPKTGEIVDVPPKKLPFFKVGKELRELVNTGGV
jgi:integration host factor subunit beta